MPTASPSRLWPRCPRRPRRPRHHRPCSLLRRACTRCRADSIRTQRSSDCMLIVFAVRLQSCLLTPNTHVSPTALLFDPRSSRVPPHDNVPSTLAHVAKTTLSTPSITCAIFYVHRQGDRTAVSRSRVIMKLNRMSVPARQTRGLAQLRLVPRTRCARCILGFSSSRGLSSPTGSVKLGQAPEMTIGRVTCARLTPPAHRTLS